MKRMLKTEDLQSMFLRKYIFFSVVLNTLCSWPLCTVLMQNLPSIFFSFSHYVISAAQLPAPVFVRSIKYTGEKETSVFNLK